MFTGTCDERRNRRRETWNEANGTSQGLADTREGKGRRKRRAVVKGKEASRFWGIRPDIGDSATFSGASTAWGGHGRRACVGNWASRIGRRGEGGPISSESRWKG